MYALILCTVVVIKTQLLCRHILPTVQCAAGVCNCVHPASCPQLPVNLALHCNSPICDAVILCCHGDAHVSSCAHRVILQELELERYNQGDAREEQLNAELSVTRQLNLSLVGCVSLLQSDLAGVSLIANCTESELNGRFANRCSLL